MEIIIQSLITFLYVIECSWDKKFVLTQLTLVEFNLVFNILKNVIRAYHQNWSYKLSKFCLIYLLCSAFLKYLYKSFDKITRL